MKPYFSVLVFLAHYAAAGPQPQLQWDPATVADCEGWYDNVGELSCESTRKLFGISPEEFHSWNPSVGLDCKPWDMQSYCIITQSKLDLLPSTTSSTRIYTTTTSSSSSTLRPSPTVWEEIGCYAEDPEMPILEQNLNPDGDAFLSISKCKDSCYHRDFEFAGVQQGNQCWCSNSVVGEWTRNQTDCNTPCSGDQAAICGGKGLLNVFKGLENSVTVSSTSAGGVMSSASTSVGNVKSSASTTVGNVESSTSPTAAVMSGAAARNAIWW